MYREWNRLGGIKNYKVPGFDNEAPEGEAVTTAETGCRARPCGGRASPRPRANPRRSSPLKKW